MYSDFEDFTYIHAKIKYPFWTPKTNIFQYIRKKIRNQLKKNNIYFVFDACPEGYSPFYMQFFDMLYFNCELYEIDPKKIIFVSSNLLDKTNLLHYCTNNSMVPFNYVMFSAYEYIVAYEIKNPAKVIKERIINYFEQNNVKNFLSLNRRNRPHRNVLNFLLYSNNLIKNNLISHDVLQIDNKQNWLRQNFLDTYDIDDVSVWQQSLPFIADKTDFDSETWAWEPPSKLYDSTCFSVVTETHSNSYDNTSLFYSEKTFRCISHLQPFIILGQPDCNANLSTLGYKLYDDWFDYSFDSIENEKRRIKELVKQIEHLSKKLDKMRNNEKLDWRFKNDRVLEYNFEILRSNILNRKIFKQFSKRI